MSPVTSAEPGISTADTGTLEAGGTRRLGSLMCLGCGWWADAMLSTAMLGSCKSLLTVEGPSLAVDSRGFAREEKDSKPGGGTLTAWVWCCCRWLNWLRTGDGSGWALKSTRLRTEGWGAEGLRSQAAVVAGGLALSLCCVLEASGNGLKPGGFNLSKIWELEMFTIFD